MKKLINDPEAVVREALEGMEAAHRGAIRVTYDPYVVVRADAPVSGKVGIISGGGSGHEPMHGGFVGRGMLDAACPGEVFTSPTPDQMLEATKAVDGGAGVLHIVKNYTGDVLNFEMAAELAQGEGIDVEAVVINDDVAVQDSLYTAGRRGVGATVLAEKICGAAAEEQRSLADVAELCRKVNANSRSMGMALTPCITPASGQPSFELAENEMEIGIGIHGEPGRYRESMASAASIVERLASAIVEDLPYESGDEVLAFVNGMGGTPLVELYVVYRELDRFLGEQGHHDQPQPDRQLHHVAGDGRLLDHAAQARRRADAALGRPRRHAGAAPRLMSITAADVRCWIEDYAAVISEHRAELVRLDTAIGDGDHGTNMDRGMRAATEKLADVDGDDIGVLLKAVGMALISKVGGAAGPLYGTLFMRMGDGHRRQVGAGPRRVDGSARGRSRRGPAARQGRAGRQDDGGRAAARRRSAARRGRPAQVGRRGARGHARDDPDGGAQGPRQLPRPAQRGPSGPGRDVDRTAPPRGR